MFSEVKVRTATYFNLINALDWACNSFILLPNENCWRGVFWPLLATVNRSTVFIRFSKQITYANISDRLLVFKGLVQGPLKSI